MQIKAKVFARDRLILRQRMNSTNFRYFSLIISNSKRFHDRPDSHHFQCVLNCRTLSSSWKLREFPIDKSTYFAAESTEGSSVRNNCESRFLLYIHSFICFVYCEKRQWRKRLKKSVLYRDTDLSDKISWRYPVVNSSRIAYAPNPPFRHLSFRYFRPAVQASVRERFVFLFNF